MLYAPAPAPAPVGRATPPGAGAVPRGREVAPVGPVELALVYRGVPSLDDGKGGGPLRAGLVVIVVVSPPPGMVEGLEVALFSPGAGVESVSSEPKLDSLETEGAMVSDTSLPARWTRSPFRVTAREVAAHRPKRTAVVNVYCFISVIIL